MTDYATAYRDLRGRVVDLVHTHPGEIEAIAPATPEWRVRDVLAHLTGICDDIVNGNLDGVGTDDWTAAQVAKRRDVSVHQLLSDWEEHGTTVEGMMSTFPPVIVGQMVYDAATHEHDIRGALAEPGARDSDAIAIAFEWGTDRFGELIGANGTFTFGTDAGEKTVGSGEPATTVRTSRFELVRAFTGRRSIEQMRAYEWDGTPRADELVLGDRFMPRDLDLVE